MRAIKYIDLFCGIGGFRAAANISSKKLLNLAECVFSSEIDREASKMYYANFGDYPSGDITKIKSPSIPDHDVLFAGFPCQPFSIIGKSKGFDDTRGTLFFEIAKILETKRPYAFVLENVKQLVSHEKGKTFKRIIETLNELGYYTTSKILNALDFGLPQKRERIFIVGFRKRVDFIFPVKSFNTKSLHAILEKEVNQKYYASDKIKVKRKSSHVPNYNPSIWHENKSGHISSYPFSCALRANASYNYLLVNGERRLTPREMLRLQGFPEDFKIVVSDSQIRKQAGNAVPVPVVEAILDKFLPLVEQNILEQQSVKVKNHEKRIEIASFT